MRVVPTSTRILDLGQTRGVLGFPGVQTTILMKPPDNGLVVGLNITRSLEGCNVE